MAPRDFQLFNTMAGQVEPLEPLEPGKVRLYTCGPTVYNYAHIGNLRTYISEDVIRRALEVGGYDVHHVMNITDVGHLESDADQGEDKMALAAAREAKSPWDIARFYEQVFFEDCQALHIQRPTVVCRATEHIEHMIRFIQGLEARGATYVVDGNVYFAIDKFPAYGRLARLRLDDQQAGARVDVDPRKRSPNDFVLWFSQSKFPNQIMQWDSPWGRGFPGWHIECSAMATEYLGDRIDIHMGGIDHIPVHHTNEIAQSEAYLQHEWVKYWMHCEFLIIDKGKMAKSGGKFLRLATLVENGFAPVHYRYFCLGGHYRSPQRFSWDALDGARRTFENFKNLVVSWKLRTRQSKAAATPDDAAQAARYAERFWDALQDDFNCPKALGVLWELARDASLSEATRLGLARDFDRVFGLGVDEFRRPEIPAEMVALIKQREEARNQKNWAVSDDIRAQLAGQGIHLMDTPEGTDWYRAE